MAKVTWHGDAVQRGIASEVGRRLKTCGQIGADHAKTLISTDGTGVGGGGNLIYGANPSRPGEPPHVQTGRLRGSIAYEVDGNVTRIGTNVIYGRHLEVGTSKMAPRPWLRRMLIERMSIFRRILTAPIKGGQ